MNEEEIKEIRKALEWYGYEAEAICRNSIVINEKAIGASVTVLGLDAGERAKRALKILDQVARRFDHEER